MSASFNPALTAPTITHSHNRLFPNTTTSPSFTHPLMATVLDPGATTPAINGRITSNDSGGFWIFKLVEKQDARDVDATMQNALKNKLATQWFDEQKTKSQIENMVTNEKRAWALEQAPAQ